MVDLVEPTLIPQQLRGTETSPSDRPTRPGGRVIDLVVPAYNEEHRIGPTLDGICQELGRRGTAARIIVVDNGSVDATSDAVDRVIRQGIDVEVIGCRTRGKGAAVRAGVAHADAEFVGYVDADQSTPPASITTALAILGSGWDVVIGSRRAVGARYLIPQPLTRRLGSRAFNIAASTVVGSISDTQCGMKLFRTSAVEDLFRNAQLNGFAFDVEIIGKALAAGLKIMELPVDWSDSSGSTLHPLRHGMAAFREIRQARLALRDDKRRFVTS